MPSRSEIEINKRPVCSEECVRSFLANPNGAYHLMGHDQHA